MGAYSRLGAYSKWALIRGWALIRINTVRVSQNLANLWGEDWGWGRSSKCQGKKGERIGVNYVEFGLG